MKYLARQRFRLQALVDRIRHQQRVPVQPTCFSGLSFSTPLGISAGIDRDAQLLDVFEQLGTGFVEIGTINNIDHGRLTAERLTRWQCGGRIDPTMRIGVSIGTLSPAFDNRVINDYLSIAQLFSSSADFLVLNLSRPRSPARNGLIDPLSLQRALDKLADLCRSNRSTHSPRLLVKLAITPVFNSVLHQSYAGLIADYCDGIIATFENWPSVYSAAEWLADNPIGLPLIAVGGVRHSSDVEQYLNSGATLVGVHRAVRLHGPAILRGLIPANMQALAAAST